MPPWDSNAAATMSALVVQCIVHSTLGICVYTVHSTIGLYVYTVHSTLGIRVYTVHRACCASRCSVNTHGRTYGWTSYSDRKKIKPITMGAGSITRSAEATAKVTNRNIRLPVGKAS